MFFSLNIEKIKNQELFHCFEINELDNRVVIENTHIIFPSKIENHFDIITYKFSFKTFLHLIKLDENFKESNFYLEKYEK